MKQRTDSATRTTANVSKKICVSAPGRICLFGEHQDYLNLPVITAAINRRVTVCATPIPERKIHLHLPDIGSEEQFEFNGAEVPYRKERDYFRSAFNVLRREGYALTQGLEGDVRGNIPINSGTSSSSALIVAWIRLLSEFSTRGGITDPEMIARLAHQAEVTEFQEPGGMMDHYACSVGGVLFQEFYPTVSVRPLINITDTFVLGDSLQPKDTKGILARVRGTIQRGVELLMRIWPEFSLRESSLEEATGYLPQLPEQEAAYVKGALENRDLTLQGRRLLSQPSLDKRRFGALLNAQQQILRDVFRISTPKIDAMLQAALEAGAYGGKINGSGGGGCMFVYAPENPKKIAKAIEEAGGKAYIITLDAGVKVERNR